MKHHFSLEFNRKWIYSTLYDDTYRYSLIARWLNSTIGMNSVVERDKRSYKSQSLSLQTFLRYSTRKAILVTVSAAIAEQSVNSSLNAMPEITANTFTPNVKANPASKDYKKKIQLIFKHLRKARKITTHIQCDQIVYKNIPILS